MGTALIRWLGKMLPARERDAVLGDVLELRMSNLRAAREICGLLARRAFGYVAPFVFVVAAADLALRFGLSLWRTYALNAWIVRNYEFIDPGILETTGLTLQRGIPILILKLLLTCLWTWTSCVGFSRLARKRGSMPVRHAAAIAGATLALGVVTGWTRNDFLLDMSFIAITAVTAVRREA